MFSLPEGSVVVDFPFEHSTSLVTLSVIVAILGAFTAFSCYTRSQKDTLISAKIWIVLASISMAVGIWSMHFSGMMAIHLPVSMSNDLLLTVLSIIPAIIAPAIAFTLISIPRIGSKTYIASGVVMGLGIIGMHLLGIYAMQFESVAFYYDPFWFMVSIVISIAGSVLAVNIFRSLKQRSLTLTSQLFASIIFGFAVASMHYSNIFAMKYYLKESERIAHGTMHDMDMAFLSAGFTLSIMFILMILLTIIFMDRYIEKRISYYDPLTRLPNRRSFQLLLESKPKISSLAIWHFHDLESYNLDHGYLFVDRLIRSIGNMFKENLPPLTEVYRTEANRFTFIAKDDAAAQDLEKLINQIRDELKDGLVFEGKEITFSGVCGFTKSNERMSLEKQYLNVMAVLNHPSIKFNFSLIEYDPKIHTRSFTEDLLEHMEDAMVNGDIYLVYQPKISSDSNCGIGVEALIRWDHPQHGFLSPGVFLPIFEANDRMMDLTDWIIGQVCRQLKLWEQRDIPITQVAINVPGPYLTSTRLMDTLLMNTLKYKVKPSAIELEITETSFVKTIESAKKAVSKFREKGFSIALDDFGTGVSSLFYLKQIPISTLKIDRSFIDGVPHSDKDASIVESMVQLGKSLNMKVVVEGVETAEQVEYLVKHCGAPTMQGFYFAKPMKPQELVDWTAAYKLKLGT